MHNEDDQRSHHESCNHVNHNVLFVVCLQIASCELRIAKRKYKKSTKDAVINAVYFGNYRQGAGATRVGNMPASHPVGRGQSRGEDVM